jgi:hypothetical protein
MQRLFGQQPVNTRLSILISYATIAVVISGGCTSHKNLPIQPTLDPNLRPQQTARVTELIEQAKECPTPAVATVNLSSSFRYGCFCGKGWPEFETLPPDASNADKHALVEKYLSIKPIDSIDEACRDHDICWVIHGEEDGYCNDEFVDRMYYILRYMFHKAADVDSTEFRCNGLALDIKASFSTLFVDDKYESAYSTGAKVGKIIGTPLMGVFGIMAAPSWAGGSRYPKAGERCIVPNFNFTTNGRPDDSRRNKKR